MFNNSRLHEEFRLEKKCFPFFSPQTPIYSKMHGLQGEMGLRQTLVKCAFDESRRVFRSVELMDEGMSETKGGKKRRECGID